MHRQVRSLPQQRYQPLPMLTCACGLAQKLIAPIRQWVKPENMVGIVHYARGMLCLSLVEYILGMMQTSLITMQLTFLSRRYTFTRQCRDYILASKRKKERARQTNVVCLPFQVCNVYIQARHLYSPGSTCTHRGCTVHRCLMCFQVLPSSTNYGQIGL